MARLASDPDDSSLEAKACSLEEMSGHKLVTNWSHGSKHVLLLIEAKHLLRVIGKFY